jgi:predicted O-methyltransferase YrrM
MISNIESKYLERQMKHFKGMVITIVEIGSWMGRSSVAISTGIKKYCPGSKFYCVDMFSSEYYAENPGLEEGTKKDIRQIFEKNMKNYSHETMVMKSLEAVELFKDESVDFIFIDADHSYDAVKADIQAWLPKLKKGCIICGHDYGIKKYGVKLAVDELFPVHSNPAKTIWETTK